MVKATGNHLAALITNRIVRKLDQHGNAKNAIPTTMRVIGHAKSARHSIKMRTILTIGSVRAVSKTSLVEDFASSAKHPTVQVVVAEEDATVSAEKVVEIIISFQEIGIVLAAAFLISLSEDHASNVPLKTRMALVEIGNVPIASSQILLADTRASSVKNQIRMVEVIREVSAEASEAVEVVEGVEEVAEEVLEEVETSVSATVAVLETKVLVNRTVLSQTRKLHLMNKALEVLQ